MNIERGKHHQRAIEQIIYLQGTSLEQGETRQGQSKNKEQN